MVLILLLPNNERSTDEITFTLEYSRNHKYNDVKKKSQNAPWWNCMTASFRKAFINDSTILCKTNRKFSLITMCLFTCALFYYQISSHVFFQINSLFRNQVQHEDYDLILYDKTFQSLNLWILNPLFVTTCSYQYAKRSFKVRYRLFLRSGDFLRRNSSFYNFSMKLTPFIM